MFEAAKLQINMYQMLLLEQLCIECLKTALAQMHNETVNM